MDEGQLAERAQVQLLVVLLVLQAGQRASQLVQGGDGHHRLRALEARKKTFKETETHRLKQTKTGSTRDALPYLNEHVDLSHRVLKVFEGRQCPGFNLCVEIRIRNPQQLTHLGYDLDG